MQKIDDDNLEGKVKIMNVDGRDQMGGPRKMWSEEPRNPVEVE